MFPQPSSIFDVNGYTSFYNHLTTTSGNHILGENPSEESMPSYLRQMNHLVYDHLRQNQSSPSMFDFQPNLQPPLGFDASPFQFSFDNLRNE